MAATLFMLKPGENGNALDVDVLDALEDVLVVVWVEPEESEEVVETGEEEIVVALVIEPTAEEDDAPPLGRFVISHERPLTCVESSWLAAFTRIARTRETSNRIVRKKDERTIREWNKGPSRNDQDPLIENGRLWAFLIA